MFVDVTKQFQICLIPYSLLTHTVKKITAIYCHIT
jgi:hypothetical protein